MGTTMTMTMSVTVTVTLFTVTMTTPRSRDCDCDRGRVEALERIPCYVIKIMVILYCFDVSGNLHYIDCYSETCNY